MGRWAQGRRRGCGGSVFAFPLPPIGDGDWQPLAVGGGEVDGQWIGGDPAGPYWGIQSAGDDSGSPGAWNPTNDVESATTNLNGGTFGAGRWWFRVAWFDTDAITQISDWSNPQFVDVA